MLIGLYIMPSLDQHGALVRTLRYLLLHGHRQFLDLVFAVGFGDGRPLLDEELFFVFVDEGAHNRVEVSLFPELLRSLRLLDVCVELRLLVVMLQVAIRYHVVVPLDGMLNRLAPFTLLLCRFWPLVRRLEVVLSQIDVAYNVVVNDCVFARAEVPGLLFRVVWSVLKAFQLVLEVQDVVGLLDSQSFVLSSLQ